ncbi:hypothetical protein PAI11_23480 [Patulibacter medicamentivorans]|uniref:DUF1778 domain-containing protein n=1 Tax=Patulibacter medicamentivorans TaxID=1097667 RepID=H0E698_9ACTN|nr:DUF1778 domain-containing protein [Patulibacter medicamentivorans]EHN10796.1 hypothetical protein PAI11_23480 [Patulibacter medicamentivorans]
MPPVRARTTRLEIRTTPEERQLLDRAVDAEGTDLTTFVLAHTTDAARRVLADRDRFVLSPEAAAAWDALNDAPARDLPSLRALLDRPSPFGP